MRLRGLKEWEKKEYIFNVGATSFDILQDYKNENLDMINKMIRKKGVGDVFQIERYKYLLFVCHPITTEDPKENLALLRLCEYSHIKTRLPIIWIWPNLDAGTEKISKAMRELREEKVENIHFFKSLKIDYFAPLLSNCGCIVGNSSSGIREASYLGIPSINIGSRQSMRQRCKNIIDMDNNKNNLKELIDIQLKRKRYKMDTTYGDGKASERILKILIRTNPDLQKLIHISMKKVLAVIPARKGSKRIKNKNLLLLNGKPLIYYTIKAAKESKYVDDWLVSSDSDEIIKIAKFFKAPVYFKRPKSLSGDQVRNAEVMIHALEYMEEKKIKYDYIFLLQPTSPFRKKNDIDKAIKLLVDSNLESIASVRGPYAKKDPNLKRINIKGNLVDYKRTKKNQFEPFYIYNASIYGIRKNSLLKNRKFVTKKQIPFIMNEIHSVDINDEHDILVAKALMQRLNKYEK